MAVLVGEWLVSHPLLEVPVLSAIGIIGSFAVPLRILLWGFLSDDA